MIKETSKNIGRSDIINWISSRLNIKVQGLQNLGAGHIYCLLINDYYPKTIGETLINHSPHSQHQYVHNLKLFQLALNKLRCGRRIQIDKLSKMKFQQNWETVSWLKRFLEQGKPERDRLKENLTSKKIQPTVQLNNQQQFREPFSIVTSICNSGKQTPLGKASITSTLIQNNYIALIDRMKQVVSSRQSENQKLRLLEMLLNLSSKQSKGKDSKQENQETKGNETSSKQKQKELDFNIEELKQLQ